MMRLFHCDMCWDTPCTCSHEAKRVAKFRAEFAAAHPPNVNPGEEWDYPTVREFRRRQAEAKEKAK